MSSGDAEGGPVPGSGPESVPVSAPVLAVVHEAGRDRSGSAIDLRLRGLRDDAAAELFAARIAVRHRRFQVGLECHGPGRHTLRLAPARVPESAPDSVPPGAASPVPLGAELLADLLGPQPGAGEPLALAGYQRELLLEAVTRTEGPDPHVEQVYWNWSGPLDRARFRAAWQSVCERESILRAAFDWTAVPRLVLHPRAEVAVVHHTHTDTGWQELLVRDRLRGFALNRPPLLRLTLLEGEAGAATRVLLTCHRALVDEYSVHLLLRDFYRAYLAGGVLPGGERRPDLRDHARWLARQNSEGARELWTRAAPPRHAATAVGRRGGNTLQSGSGRLRRRLSEAHSARLRSWAAARGVGESGALHVVWALLLYRAAGAEGPLRVSFGVRMSGRDIVLPGAGGIPGVLGNPLPMTVRVDPAAPLAGLLRQVRDALLDMVAYPWVSGDRIREWTGRGEGERLTDSVVSFDSPAELPPDVRRELEVQGIDVDEPRGIGAGTSLPITVVARHEGGRTLVLDAVYDRASLADADAAAVLGQCAGLLRALPELSAPDITVGQVLELLADVEAPSMAPRAPGFRRTTVRTLRGGAPGADVICLIGVPGVAAGVQELFVRAHRGPERIVALQLGALPTAVATPDGPAGLTELTGLVGLPGLPGLPGSGGRLVLCGCGPAAAAAYELARALAYGEGSVPVSVVMTGLTGPEGSAEALARGLAALPARRC
ncbi:condensation domain-containing protein [Streptomyces sp. NPDC059443]|uniref:condensation domain-containing protein n=1 Tax=unclassified Streptomyces TaxID=2593676 RepID=UPI00367E3B4C